MKKLSDNQINMLFESRELTKMVKAALVKMRQDVRHRYSKAFYLIPKIEGKPDAQHVDYPDLLALRKERDTTLPFCDHYYKEIEKDIAKHELAMSFAQFEYEDEIEGKTNSTELLNFVLQATYQGEGMAEPENIFARILRQAYYEFQIKEISLQPIAEAQPQPPE
ncbi:hypothetical protein [Roseivirga thermotolerans]|uniref:Uncharacterized protein n=1 Tax=Roseivirga thermotolerans TaxID=1758176 RepID=A0ABQ3I8K3_9BACT|nr:hypothetical protein [Roseivirga thermotolerans]GHE64886.1 hypothetical protein GCM10011340_19860 [Roseivirga thermotolerans]